MSAYRPNKPFALSLSKGVLLGTGFDKLSPNGYSTRVEIARG